MQVQPMGSFLLTSLSYRAGALSFGKALIDLENKPLMRVLLRKFVRAKDGILNHELAVRAVYKYRPTELICRSARFRESTRQRTVKLISRARVLLRKHCAQELPEGFDFLTFDPESKCWHLIAKKKFGSDSLRQGSG